MWVCVCTVYIYTHIYVIFFMHQSGNNDLSIQTSVFNLHFHNILYIFKNLLINSSKWDQKVQIIPNIFLVTCNTVYATLLCTTETSKTK